MLNEEVPSEYSSAEQKQHKKHKNDHWRLLKQTYKELEKELLIKT